MICLADVEKSYHRGAEEVHALRGVNLEIGPGEFVSISGPSGAGKTTLLHILGCLDIPTSGAVHIDGQAVEHLSERELVQLRRQKIGFVFQQFHLLPGLSVLENVALPLLFARKTVPAGELSSLLDRVGLGHRSNHLPSQLSGGEMQRVAIARALVNKPEIVLADEPTGNLDSENSDRIIGLLRSIHEKGLSVVMITHNGELARQADRIIMMKDGRIQ